jgi:hypothetical protein
MCREVLPPHTSMRVNAPGEALLTLIFFFDAATFLTTVMKRVGWLPLEERRRIMAAQAEKVTPAYAQEAEWQGWEGGDIVAYEPNVAEARRGLAR